MNFHTEQLFNLFDLHSNKLNQNSIRLAEEVRQLNSPKLFVFTMLWDIVHLPSEGWILLNNFLETLTKNKNCKILLLFTDWLKNKISLSERENIEVCYLNGIALTAYIEIFKLKKAHVNPFWNSEAEKFLFLTGKWYKTNRFKLFYKLYENNLIDKSLYSLFLPKTYPTKFTNQLPNISTKEYDLFVNKYNCNADNTRTLTHDESQDFITHHVAAIPFDLNLYKKTSFRLISETEFDDDKDPWITEKTWITIFNKHPFIMAGQKGTLEKLSNLGFKIFNNYLPIDNYDQLSENNRMEAIVTNVKFWLNHIRDFKIDIEKDVNHNFNLLTHYCEKDYRLLDSIIYKYSLDTEVGRLTQMTFY